MKENEEWAEEEEVDGEKAGRNSLMQVNCRKSALREFSLLMRINIHVCMRIDMPTLICCCPKEVR